LDRTAKMSHTQNNALHKTGCGVTVLATAVFYMKLSTNARYVLVTQYSCSTWVDGMSLPTEQLGRANQESQNLSIHFQNFTPI